MRNHFKFILTPMSTLIDNATNAISGVEPGLASYPLGDYIMQSLFLRMTGFQEQKMKCVCWELATDDYELRYERYKNWTLGECSSYDDKKAVFLDLVRQLEKKEKGLASLSQDERDGIISETREKLKGFCKQLYAKGWSQRAYQDFEMLVSQCDYRCLLLFNKVGDAKDILGHCDNCANSNNSCGITEEIGKEKALIRVYEKIIKYRNRCAHNTTSYQQNLPNLETMDDPIFICENYYLYFFVLIIIDELFIKLFQRYLEAYDVDSVL